MAAKVSVAKVSKEELIEDHIRYEANMLLATNAKLVAGGTGDQVLNNALIESFCIHARQLIDFFNNKQGVPASDFTSGNYQCKEVSKLPDELMQKLNTQIAHITYRRTSQGSDKIDANDRAQLAAALSTELRNFAQYLRPDFARLWAKSTQSIPIGTNTTASATNQITLVSSTTR